MTLTTPLIFSFGASRTGLTDLRAQPLTLAGAATGDPIDTGFVEIGGGIYQFTGTIPDDTESVKAYSVGTPAVVGVVTVDGSTGGSSGGDEGGDDGDSGDGPTNIADALAEAALGPLSASGDGQNYTGHNLKDLIAADEYQAQKAAGARRGLGIRRVKMIPPGNDC